MDFMSWSLNAPSSSIFNEYMEKQGNEWVMIDEEAINNWSDSDRNMFNMFHKYHEKIRDFGMHEFGIDDNGNIYDYRATYLNVLNEDKTKINSWVPTSIQYLIETYPEVDYSIQLINFGSKVDQFLHVNRDTAIPEFISQVKKIAELYNNRWSSVNTIELDFEKVYTLEEGDSIDGGGTAVGNDWDVYADFIKRVKDEVCIPLGLKLRVNMYAMTGDFNPHYYGWHDYKTLASRKDINGNQAIDEFQLMTYDFSWAGSAPGPSTPQWWLKDVLEHVQDSLPPEKTWIGNAGYGRRWGLDDQQRGSTVTFNQITMWQNGMYVHNHGGEGNKWIWHDQDWLPFAGFNDDDSGYQITYLHLYDKFRAYRGNRLQGVINQTRFSDREIITSYFKSQQPIFSGIKQVVNNVSYYGNISKQYSTNGETIPARYLGKDKHFQGAYRANNPLYIYNKDKEICEPSPELDEGVKGKIEFDFSLISSGNHKLIALVHFNTLENNQINASLNGNPFTIGGDNLNDWFPFYVDKSTWIDLGNFNFDTFNKIEIDVSKGFIWGFVVCDDFNQNFLGGTAGFNSNIMPHYKRDINGNPVTANLPEELTITGEILRRPPRPAIIFEDNFIHFLTQNEAGLRIDNVTYYMNVQEHWESGGVKRYHEQQEAYACTDEDGFKMIGFTDGRWTLNEKGTVEASAGIGISNQLILYKKLKSNVQVKLDFKVTGTYPKAGIRFLATREGYGNEGYLALVDFSSNKVVVGYEDGKDNWTELASTYMSSQLENLKGSTISLYATVLDGKAYVKVGDREYLSEINLDTSISEGAYGAYISEGEIELSLLNVSTVDRYEPLEKLEVEIGNDKYTYGEVERTDENDNVIEYDDYGYLIYSGLDIDCLGQSDPEIPDDEGGSILLDFDEDFSNLPLARHNSWSGKQEIKVRMVDAGIWFRNLYIGDSEGYSVAYNSDYTGFIETVQLISEYKCRGVAMWTMGQEDPLIFTYLPES